MTNTASRTRPTLWLVVAGVLSLLSIAVLWPLQFVGQVCILIYPAPPGCGAEEPRWVPFVAIGLVVALLAAAVIVYFTVAASRTPIILLTAGIIVVVAIAATVADGEFLPAGAVTLPSQVRHARYEGAAPPAGDGEHRYVFTVSALDVERIDLPDDSSPATLGTAIRDHVVAVAQLVGVSETPAE
jgi:hypothetical protein